MITGSKELIRDINSRLVLESIINRGPISRAAISKLLGLTKATISAIVQELMSKNLVIEIGSDDTQLGRKPILLEFHAKAGYAVCVDIGIDCINAMRTNLRGEQLLLEQEATPKNPSKLGDALIGLIRRLILEEDGELSYGLVGITLGIHGVVKNHMISFVPYYNMNGLDLERQLSGQFGVPVFMENEANLSVLGEKTFLYDYPSMANISVHSGIGLGLILDDKLYTGYDGHAGEIGHTIVEIDGKPCPCGNHGCLEQYISERVLLSEFAEKKGISSVSADDFFQYYVQGDADAAFILDKFVKYMAVCVNNVLNSFNPDVVIINSVFVAYTPSLIARIEGALHSRMNAYQKILPSGLQDASILLGGICVAAKAFLSVENFHVARNMDE